MKRVIIESPYAGGVEANVEYARRCVRDSLDRGESPIAFHLLHTQPGILDDQTPEERDRGISAGLEWTRFADLVAVYHDLGISDGMKLGINRAATALVDVEYREIDDG